MKQNIAQKWVNQKTLCVGHQYALWAFEAARGIKKQIPKRSSGVLSINKKVVFGQSNFLVRIMKVSGHLKAHQKSKH